MLTPYVAILLEKPDAIDGQDKVAFKAHVTMLAIAKAKEVLSFLGGIHRYNTFEELVRELKLQASVLVRTKVHRPMPYKERRILAANDNLDQEGFTPLSFQCIINEIRDIVLVVVRTKGDDSEEKILETLSVFTDRRLKEIKADIQERLKGTFERTWSQTVKSYL